jgi:branched-chain amino acid transport system substrate-binding protein
MVQSKVILLKNVNIFSFMDDKELFILAKRVEQLEFNLGEVIIRQYDEGDSMYLLVDGELSVFVRKSHQDMNEIKVAEINSGQFFGEMSLLTGDSRSATIVANNDAIVLEVTQEHLQDLLHEYPNLLDELVEVVAQRRGMTNGNVSVDEKKDIFDIAKRRFRRI